MGALAETAPHAPAVRIQHALDELSSGNSLEYLRLQHTLRGTNPGTLSPILTGLTHFAVKLHDDLPQRPLHTLFHAALQIDLPTVAAHGATLRATTAFLQNLISADASFIEPVLQLVTRAFLLPVDARGALMRAVLDVVRFLLATQPRAAALVTKVVRARFPHAVRPAEEHAPYMRGVLELSRAFTPAIARALAAVVFERLAAVEALVPAEVRFPDGALVPEAEKMERMLMEMFRHFDQGRGKEYLARCFEPAYEAYESFVVPCEARFTSYALLYAAEVGGAAVVRDTVERLRAGFFDRGMSPRLGEKFLEHSTGLVVRARAVDGAAVDGWVRHMAGWLNAYIDSAGLRGSEREVDADVHHGFYTGCAAWMVAVVRRRDAVDADGLAEMRAGRIAGCGMRPLAMVDARLAEEFLDVATEAAQFVVDGGYKPSRTRFGGRNVFEFAARTPDLDLPRAAEMIDSVVRWDRAEVGTPILSEADAGEDAMQE